MAGKPWTEEHRKKFQEALRNTNAKKKELYGPSGRSIETKEKWLASFQNSAKARTWLPELFQLLLAISAATKNKEVRDALNDAYPGFNAHLAENASKPTLLFNQSIKKLRADHGIHAEKIWRKLFTCVQRGGYSQVQQKAYDSMWCLNEDARDQYLIQELSHRNKGGFTVSDAVKALLNFQEKARTYSDAKIGKNEYGYSEVQSIKKKITVLEERRELREKRAVLKKEAAKMNKIEQQRRRDEWQKEKYFAPSEIAEMGLD